MTTRHTIIEACDPRDFKHWLEALMKRESYEAFVRFAISILDPQEEGREVSMYDANDSQVDVIIPEGHFIISVNIADKTFVLEEIRGG